MSNIRSVKLSATCLETGGIEINPRRPAYNMAKALKRRAAKAGEETGEIMSKQWKVEISPVERESPWLSLIAQTMPQLFCHTQAHRPSKQLTFVSQCISNGDGELAKGCLTLNQVSSSQQETSNS
eukprot:scaffold72309_cov32-Prasinocladus_malaysianus.AAC.1